MIYTAKELLNKLTNLTLVGQEEDGSLMFCGTPKQWDKSEICHWCEKADCTCYEDDGRIHDIIDDSGEEIGNEYED